MSAGRPRTAENVEWRRAARRRAEPEKLGDECTRDTCQSAHLPEIAVCAMHDLTDEQCQPPHRQGKSGDPVVTATVGMITLLVGLTAWGLALIVVAP